jgi:thymidylate synthase (FAD)
MLDRKIECLDHGHVVLMDKMGDDGAIVQAARTSYQLGTTISSDDRQLINYLYRHKHTTPFEMVEFKFHCKMPIFVARQWIRHRMASVNEYSARYSILTKEFYLPKPEQLASQSKSNKQGRAKVLEGKEADRALHILKQDSLNAYDNYEVLLNEVIGEDGKPQKLDENCEGLARELARMTLPVNYYTQWIWKIDLHNLLHFLSLRLDSHAQYEIRVFAEAIYELIKPYVPHALEAFDDYHPYRNAETFSSKELNVLSYLLQNPESKVTVQTGYNFSKGEWTEFRNKLEKYAPERLSYL